MVLSTKNGWKRQRLSTVFFFWRNVCRRRAVPAARCRPCWPVVVPRIRYGVPSAFLRPSYGFSSAFQWP